MKSHINKKNSSFKLKTYNPMNANLINYGLFMVGYLLLYHIMSMLLVTLFNSTGVIIARVLFAGLGLFLYFKHRCKYKTPSFQPKIKPNKQTVIYWIVYLTVAAYVLLSIFQFILNKFPETAMAVDTQHSMLYYVITAGILAPLCEEATYRLFVYNHMKRSSDWKIAMLATSIMFAASHMSISHLLMATMFGIILTIACECTGLWFISIIGHIIYNMISLFCPSKFYFSNSTVMVVIAAIILVFMTLMQTLMVDRLHSDSDCKDLIFKPNRKQARNNKHSK